VPHIFLSYRREDSAGFAGRLADALEAEFGTESVFRDVDDIRPGEDFIQCIESHLQQVGAVLVMIGPRWLVIDSSGQRLRDFDVDQLIHEFGLGGGRPAWVHIAASPGAGNKGQILALGNKLAKTGSISLEEALRMGV